jgi:hypothetical protein
MSCKLCSLFSSNYGTSVLAYVPGFNSFLLLRDEQNSKCVCVGGGVGGHKMLIVTANIPTFHSRYRRLVLIINEFHKFC